MKQIIQNLNDGNLEIIEVPYPNIKKGHLIIKTTCSMLSSGTEKMLLDFGKSSYFEKGLKQPDKLKEVVSKVKTDGIFNTFEKVKNKLNSPLSMGYSNVGVVLEVGEGLNNFEVGQRVVSNGPHAEVVLVPQNLCVPLTDEISDAEASFTILGSIALQGIRLANPLIGETFLVSGLGTIGLLTCQILIANGCKVIGLDIDQKKCDLAKHYGVEAFNINQINDLKSLILEKNNFLEIDGALITASTSSTDPIHLAAKVMRQRGRIILVGVTGLNLKRDLFYKKEISFQVSCSYGPGRYDPSYELDGIDYPYGLVRWTEKRNMRAIVDLLSNKKLSVNNLISHEFKVDQFQKAYELLLGKNHYLGILIRYEDLIDNKKKTIKLDYIDSKYSRGPQKTNVNFIGAGNYCRTNLIPAFVKSGACLSIISSNTGLNPIDLARKFKFKEATTNINSCFEDQISNTIVICTRHDSHAKYIIEALNCKKNVFVEKPICLNIDELQNIKRAYYETFKEKNRPILMVGFNRRFSPLVIKMKDQIQKLSGPKSLIYTCNAGFVESNNWIHDIRQGGGRLIGEACHFLDLARFLIDSKIKNINKSSLSKGSFNNDTFTLHVEFMDGSIATIHYISIGSKSFPKERIEVFANECVLQLDNFRKLRSWGIKNFTNFRNIKQDKGQNNCVKSFVKAIESGSESPIPFDELIEVQEFLLSLEAK